MTNLTEVNIAAACHECGETGKLKASATRGEVTRYFCHNDEKSCYNDRRGTYFIDKLEVAT